MFFARLGKQCYLVPHIEPAWCTHIISRSVRSWPSTKPCLNPHVRYLWLLQECACGCMPWISTRISSKRSSLEWTPCRYFAQCGVRLVQQKLTGCHSVTIKDSVGHALPIYLWRRGLFARLVNFSPGAATHVCCSLGVIGVEWRAGTSQQGSQGQAQRGATHRGRSGSANAGICFNTDYPHFPAHVNVSLNRLEPLDRTARRLKSSRYEILCSLFTERALSLCAERRRSQPREARFRERNQEMHPAFGSCGETDVWAGRGECALGLAEASKQPELPLQWLLAGMVSVKSLQAEGKNSSLRSCLSENMLFRIGNNRPNRGAAFASNTDRGSSPSLMFIHIARNFFSGWQKRWTATAHDILDHEVNLTGDIFLSAAFVSYLGAFTGPFRASLVESWTIILRDKGVRVSDGFSLAQVRKEKAVKRGNLTRISDYNYVGVPTKRLILWTSADRANKCTVFASGSPQAGFAERVAPAGAPER